MTLHPHRDASPDVRSPQSQLQDLHHLSTLALSLYDLPAGCTTELINLSENATYRVDHAAGGRCWALRIHRPGYHTDMAIRSELAWLQALRHDHVVTTPVPVAGLNGDILQRVTHPLSGESRNAVMFHWEAGVEPGVDQSLEMPFEHLGHASARMHAHARTWQRPPWFERFTWNHETAIGDAPHWGRWRDGLGLNAPLEDLFVHTSNLVRDRLARFGTGPDRFGLAHCDVRLANLLVDGNEVKVIDFDDCGFSWFLYDAATAVSFYEHLPQTPRLIRHWVAGYRRVADLSQAEENEIPTFIMLRRLLLVAWIGSHRETDLARSLGVEYTAQTEGLCLDYLKRFS